MSQKDYATFAALPENAGLTLGELYERSEDIPSNLTANPTMGDILNARLGRRAALRGMLATAAAAAVIPPFAAPARAQSVAAGLPGARFVFDEIAHGVDERHHVSPGYDADIVIRWGDPLFADSPAFDPERQTGAAQARQFGYNCDYVGLAPMPGATDTARAALMCVNHEYTSPEIMFRGVSNPATGRVDATKMTKDMVDVEMAAHGTTVVEIVKGANGKWTYVRGGRHNRRIDINTPMRVSGPAAGHDRLKTSADPTGRAVNGTINNCAGGMTPWGTYLTAEENFHGYFGGALAAEHRETANHRRYGVPGRWYNWAAYYDRFDLAKEPNEPNRHGWIVEIDPYDPNSTPIKRTAMGRFKHEGAETIVARDGRVVAYSGDDERFEYAFKFVTAGRYNAQDRRANMNLLDEGTLYVAKFNADGSGEWLPLVHGQGPLTAANGFASQADVLIEARRAGDVLGATKMDRPEDFEPNKRTGKVYLALTNNNQRTAAQVEASNPRAENNWGHLIEVTETGDDHTATTFRWEMLVRCGNPANPAQQALYNPATTANGWFACPDNMAIDPQGRLWVGTDQGTAWKAASGTADGVWAMETDGALRGTSRMFFRAPVGAEICGMNFTSDGRAMTVAVQHPATDGARDYAPFGRHPTFDDMPTRWPDFQANMPARPSVVMITKRDGGVIGG
ncbi:MAG: PhoX family phosphatase [Magnetospirillum sp.]|nr:PhoX family phosphatase [Magnetospirillum sp.]